MLRRSSSVTKLVSKNKKTKVIGNMLQSASVQKKSYGKEEKSTIKKYKDMEEYIKNINPSVDTSKMRCNPIFVMQFYSNFKFFFLNSPGTGNRFTESFMQNLEVYLKVRIMRMWKWILLPGAFY